MAIEEKEEQTTSLKDLIELVEKDPLPSNVFTIEDKDPMVILGKLNEVIAYLKNLQATINASDSKANQALESALTALTNATNAITASTTALNSSNKALETANLAIDTANTSLEGSNQAKTSSSEALDKANNALQIAQEALNQVTESLGSKVYDNNGNLKNNVKFAGHNGINVDLAEDNETFDIRLDEDITKAIEDTHKQAQANAEDIVNLTEKVADNTEGNAIAHDRLTNVETNLTEINPKVARALLTPMSPPSQHFELVGVDTSNSQVMRKLGDGFAVTNADTIIVTGRAKTDLSNVNYPIIAHGGVQTGAGDVVEEMYVSLDDTVWYRKWKSGWKECGGVISQSASNGDHKTITLPIEFNNNVYTLIITPMSSKTWVHSWVYSKTTKSFEYGSGGNGSADTSNAIQYYCSGY